MKKQLLLLLLVSLFMTSSSFAYTIFGTRTCGDLLSSDRDNNKITELVVGVWMQGYITARNYELRREVDHIDVDSLYYAVIKFCRDNPLQDNDDAAIHIYSNLEFK
jgi:hypothetical protein